MKLKLISLALLIVAWHYELNFVVAQVKIDKGVPTVKLSNGGVISGEVKNSREGKSYSSFIGIQYATVSGRFEEAKPVTTPTWEGVLSATKPGPICPQHGVPVDSPNGIREDENCLNLNVYVPIKTNGSPKKGYPVMVWVHGGAFVSGSGYGYGPQFFMDEDVILVTLNYRVGAFGFFSTGDSVIPGNNGLKDVVWALKWVQKNIKPFGGDAGKVTIFGESAGGASVHHLLLSPTTKGLIHRAISQSGSAVSHWSYYPNPRKYAVQMATHAKCPTTAAKPSEISSEEILTCLKGLTMDEFNKAQNEFIQSWPLNMRGFYFAPTMEPNTKTSDVSPFHSEPPLSLLTRKDSQLKEIPWMVGTVEDESACMYAGVVLSSEQAIKEANSDWERVSALGLDYDKYIDDPEERAKIARKIKQFYFGDKEISEATSIQLTNMFTDEMFLHGVYTSAVETAKKGKKHPVYFYQYAYEGPKSLMGIMFQVKGKQTELVGHADELQHQFQLGAMSEVFPGVGGPSLMLEKEADIKFSKNLVKLWASFAIHGEPKHSWGPTAPHWQPISKKEQDGQTPLKWFRIGENTSVNELGQSLMDRMKFWDSLWTEHFTPVVMANLKVDQNHIKIEL